MILGLLTFVLVWAGILFLYNWVKHLDWQQSKKILKYFGIGLLTGIITAVILTAYVTIF